MKFLFAAVTFAGLVIMPALAQAPAADPIGVWLTESGDTRVRLGRCGGSFCGTILAVSGENRDVNNPDPAKQARPLVGATLIDNVRQNGDGTWTGSLYNYKDGKTYTGKLRLKGASALEVSGCVLGGLFCRSQT